MINRQVPRIEAGLDVIDADAWWRGFCGLLGRRTSFGPDVLPLVETVEQLLGEVLDHNLEGPLHIDQRAVGPAALAAKLRVEIDNLRAMRPRNGRGLLAARLASRSGASGAGRRRERTESERTEPRLTKGG